MIDILIVLGHQLLMKRKEGQMKESKFLWFFIILVMSGCGAGARRAPASYAQEAYYPGEAYYANEVAEYKADKKGMAAPMPVTATAASGYAFEEEGMLEAEMTRPNGEYGGMGAGDLILAAEKGVPAKSGEPAGPAPEEQPEEPSLPDAVVEGRVIIYDARVVLAVFQIQEELEKIRKQIKGWGGYMISMNSNSIVFRIPVEKFDDIVDEVSGIGELISKDITGQDVTDEFRDLKIKLKNALATRDRLVELLGKAHTVKESLLIEAELKRLLEEIELIKGRLKFLQESALYSKITVYLESKETYKKPIPKLPAPLQWLQYELGLNALFEQ
jgi:hypothetical protein